MSAAYPKRVWLRWLAAQNEDGACLWRGLESTADQISKLQLGSLHDIVKQPSLLLKRGVQDSQCQYGTPPVRETGLPFSSSGGSA